MPELGIQNQEPGVGGRYIFTDLDEVDSIILELEVVRDEIDSDGLELYAAVSVVRDPAEDGMSQGQVQAYRASLKKAIQHNGMMSRYVSDQIDKLSAALSDYTGTDTEAAAQVRAIGRVDR
jgi:hypothetical protein